MLLGPAPAPGRKRFSTFQVATTAMLPSSQPTHMGSLIAGNPRDIISMQHVATSTMSGLIALARAPAQCTRVGSQFELDESFVWMMNPGPKNSSRAPLLRRTLPP